MKTTAERIREAMVIRGMRQVELAEKTRISKGALSSYMSGKYVPKQDNIHKIAQVLEVNPSWLMGIDAPSGLVMTIGDRIKRVRESNRIGQTELALATKISKQNIYKYENNIITNIPSDKIEAIAKFLEISPAYLMGWEETINENNPTDDEDAELLKLLENPDIADFMRKFDTLNEQEQDAIIELARVMAKKYEG